MGYLIAILIALIIILFVLAACIAAGRHDRLYFEKGVPVNKHGLSPYSARIPEDKEKTMGGKNNGQN